jgi:hypothetical protein
MRSKSPCMAIGPGQHCPGTQRFYGGAPLSVIYIPGRKYLSIENKFFVALSLHIILLLCCCWVSVHKIKSTGVKGKILACHHPTAAVYTQQTNCFAREKNIKATSQKMGERRLMSRAITYRCAQRERSGTGKV